MSKISVSADVLAKLKHLADEGDVIASVLFAAVENQVAANFTIAAKVGNVITISGKLTKVDGRSLPAVANLIAESFPVAGAGTMAVHTPNGGTSKAGAASKALWLQTNADGTFSIDVTDATAGDPCLVRFTMDNGMTEEVLLGF